MVDPPWLWTMENTAADEVEVADNRNNSWGLRARWSWGKSDATRFAGGKRASGKRKGLCGPRRRSIVLKPMR